MATERLKERLDQLKARLPNVRGRGEEATKQALVLPMLDALGFDIWNPGEVCPEFDADFSVKKGGQKERVDLAIVLENLPCIFLEVKAIDTPLDGHEGQLARYFNSVRTVSLGILTNGSEYRFFTDTVEPNLMDAVPFHVLRLEGLEYGLEVLSRFHRTNFSASAIRDYATELNHTAQLVGLLRNELDLRNREPSDSFVRWVLQTGALHDGRVTAAVVERFRPIAKNALNSVIRDIVRRSFAALDEQIAAPMPTATVTPLTGLSQLPVEASGTPPQKDSSHAQEEEEEARARIVTTERELAAVALVRQLFETSSASKKLIFDGTTKKEVPIEFGYKDTSAYLGIYFNKPAWWALRLNIEAKKPWMAVNAARERVLALLPPGIELLPPSALGEVRVPLSQVDDLKSYAGVLFAAFEQTLADRRSA